MEEVVAKKANLIPGYVILIVLGVVFAILGIVFYVNEYEIGAVIVSAAVGVFMLVAGIIGLVLYCKSPKIYITYKDGKLHLLDGPECYPLDGTDVLIKLTRTNGIVSPTGGLVLTVGGRRIEYKNVYKVKDVQYRLGELFEISRNAYLASLKQQDEYDETDEANDAPFSEFDNGED